MNKKDTHIDFRKLIEMYKKENCSINTLGNRFTYPRTKKGRYKEHMVIKTSSNVSLTSSKEVEYYELINGEGIKRGAETNLLGLQANGKNQYGLAYVFKEDYGKNFSETKDLNINILKEFGVFNKSVFIAYNFRMWVAIKAQDQGNVLFRGQSSHQMRSQLSREDSLINLNLKLCNMSDLEVYDYIKKNTTMSEMFWMEQRYYYHFKNFNYYTEKEGEEIRKKEMQQYKESKMSDRDDLL